MREVLQIQIQKQEEKEWHDSWASRGWQQQNQQGDKKLITAFTLIKDNKGQN